MKPDEQRQHFLWIFKKTILRIKDDQGPIYLIRYSLFTTPWFAVKIHKILMSDDACFHDHPWSFISIILWGGYTECQPFRAFSNGMPDDSLVHRQYYSAGSILWRKAPSPHRLEISNPATTLVITFKKIRLWGFYTLSGWKPWFEYISSGRKCE